MYESTQLGHRIPRYLAKYFLLCLYVCILREEISLFVLLVCFFIFGFETGFCYVAHAALELKAEVKISGLGKADSLPVVGVNNQSVGDLKRKKW